jgi:hypothetical protein
VNICSECFINNHGIHQVDFMDDFKISKQRILNEIINLNKNNENKTELTKNELQEIISNFRQKTILLETLYDEKEKLRNIQNQIKNTNNHLQLVEILEKSIQKINSNNSKLQSIQSLIDKLKSQSRVESTGPTKKNVKKEEKLYEEEKLKKEEKFISPGLFSELIEYSKEKELTLDPYIVPNFIPQPFESFLETQDEKIKMPFQLKISNIVIIE